MAADEKDRIAELKRRVERLGYLLYQNRGWFEIRNPWPGDDKPARFGVPVEGVDDLEHLVERLEAETKR